MNKWLKVWWSKFRLKTYDVLIGAARKLRTVQVDEAIKNANAPGGYEYFGNLILKLRPDTDGTLLALYQCKNKKFHLQQIRTEDFIHGTAMLPTANSPYPLNKIIEDDDSRLGRISVVLRGRLPYDTVETELTDAEKEMLDMWKIQQGQ
jgi:hypothetical protein